MVLLPLRGNDLAILRSPVVTRDGQNVLMFPRERKFRYARADPIRFTNALIVPKMPGLDCLHEFNARQLFSVRGADFFCADPTNFPPGPGSFSASPEQNQLPVPYSRRSPMHLHYPPPASQYPHAFTSASPPPPCAGHCVAVLSYENRLFIGFFSAATLLVGLSADTPRSFSSRVHRTASLPISSVIVAEVAHASAPLLRAGAPLPHCAADGVRADLAADFQSGRECGSDRGRLCALPPAVQGHWGSRSANPKITFPLVNRSFRKSS
jgi:hypothetical protein